MSCLLAAELLIEQRAGVFVKIIFLPGDKTCLEDFLPSIDGSCVRVLGAFGNAEQREVDKAPARRPAALYAVPVRHHARSAPGDNLLFTGGGIRFPGGGVRPVENRGRQPAGGIRLRRDESGEASFSEQTVCVCR